MIRKFSDLNIQELEKRDSPSPLGKVERTVVTTSTITASRSNNSIGEGQRMTSLSQDCKLEDFPNDILYEILSNLSGLEVLKKVAFLNKR